MTTSRISMVLKKTLAGFAAAALMSVSIQALALEFYGDAYGFSASGAPAGATGMRVTGPEGFAAESDSLSYSSEEALPDGSYSYEITGPLQIEKSAVDTESGMDQGRDRATRRVKPTGVVASGHFWILQGKISVPDNEKEEPYSEE